MPNTEEQEKKKKLRVEFVLNEPEAKEVLLLGDFNHWDPTGASMKRDKNGTWKLRMSIPPGRYEYKLLIDGLWCLDGKNLQRVTNRFGTKNNVLILPEK